MSDLAAVDTPALLARVESLAAADPEREDEERWAIVGELHRRSDAPIYETATRWCSSRDWMLRCLGADVLGQLGFQDGHPFSEGSTPTLTMLLRDAHPHVIASALAALHHLGTGDLAAICALRSHASPDVRQAVAF